jgi:hypothetical protein
MARYPYDDVLGAYIDADALVDIARDEAIGTNSPLDALAWTLLFAWCPVLDCVDVQEIFVEDA